MITAAKWCRYPEVGDVRLQLRDYQIQSGMCVVTAQPGWLKGALHWEFLMNEV